MSARFLVVVNILLLQFLLNVMTGLIVAVKLIAVLVLVTMVFMSFIDRVLLI